MQSQKPSAPVKDKKKVVKQDSWPTLPCCDAMRAGLPCDCCEVVDV